MHRCECEQKCCVSARSKVRLYIAYVRSPTCTVNVPNTKKTTWSPGSSCQQEESKGLDNRSYHACCAMVKTLSFL